MIVVPAAALVMVLSAAIPRGGSGAVAPNDVDCAFRELAMRVASRNLAGSKRKLELVSAGINATDCPGGDRWTTAYSSSPDAARRRGGSTASAARSVFVSPTSGSDSGAGTEASPLRTLAAAQVRVRALLKQSSGAVTVNLRAGTYYSSLVLGPADSGTPAAPVTWQAFEGEQAIISGGQRLRCEWHSVSLGHSVSAYSCVLPTGTHRPFQSLFVDGRRLQRARYPNGDPTYPCNGASGCQRAGYTSAGPAAAQEGVGACRPDATPLTGQQALVKHGALTLSAGVISTTPASTVTLQVADDPFVHDAGAFVDYQAFVGGGVKCYNSSYNMPFWNAGTCNCKNFTMSDQDGARAARWSDPTTGVVREHGSGLPPTHAPPPPRAPRIYNNIYTQLTARGRVVAMGWHSADMFHSVRWGGWAFNITGFNKARPPPPPPPLPPGTSWGPIQHCTSCLPHDTPIQKMPEHRTLVDCEAACEADARCHYINYAEEGNHACYLFASCSQPWTSAAQCRCSDGGSNCSQWWSTLPYRRNASRPITADPPLGGYGGLGVGGTPPPSSSPASFLDAAVLQISGGQQTGQQGSDTISHNDYFVENIKEELDAPGEWFLDGTTLYVIPPVGTQLSASTLVESAVEPRVIQLRGSHAGAYAHHITVRGVTVAHSAPTFMSDFEMPSGGGVQPPCVRCTIACVI